MSVSKRESRVEVRVPLFLHFPFLFLFIFHFPFFLIFFFSIFSIFFFSFLFSIYFFFGSHITGLLSLQPSGLAQPCAPPLLLRFLGSSNGGLWQPPLSAAALSLGSLGTLPSLSVPSLFSFPFPPLFGLPIQPTSLCRPLFLSFGSHGCLPFPHFFYFNYLHASHTNRITTTPASQPTKSKTHK